MSRLIDADAVEKVLEEKHFRRVLDSDRWLIADIRKSIMDLPTIDAVPVIRCKDCKHFNPMRKVWRCTQSMVGMISEAEDYCSRAELKEADG